MKYDKQTINFCQILQRPEFCFRLEAEGAVLEGLKMAFDNVIEANEDTHSHYELWYLSVRFHCRCAAQVAR